MNKNVLISKTQFLAIFFLHPLEIQDDCNFLPNKLAIRWQTQSQKSKWKSSVSTISKMWFFILTNRGLFFVQPNSKCVCRRISPSHSRLSPKLWAAQSIRAWSARFLCSHCSLKFQTSHSHPCYWRKKKKKNKYKNQENNKCQINNSSHSKHSLKIVSTMCRMKVASI